MLEPETVSIIIKTQLHLAYGFLSAPRNTMQELMLPTKEYCILAISVTYRINNFNSVSGLPIVLFDLKITTVDK